MRDTNEGKCQGGVEEGRRFDGGSVGIITGSRRGFRLWFGWQGNGGNDHCCSKPLSVTCLPVCRGRKLALGVRWALFLLPAPSRVLALLQYCSNGMRLAQLYDGQAAIWMLSQVWFLCVKSL